MNKRSEAMIGKNLEDLTQHHFGYWTVISRARPPKWSSANRPATYWLCRCKCGAEKVISAGSLKSGSSTSCGCKKIEKLSNNVDLMDMDFDRWHVIGLGKPRVSRVGRVYKTWTCKCQCGTIRDVDEYSLIRHLSKSCGCLRKERVAEVATYEDLSNQHFGEWTVLKRVPDRFYPGGGRATMWLCRCSCGTEHVVAGNMLKSGISQSCGCLNVRSIVEQHVREYLDERGITYIANQSFLDLKGPRGGNLSYDFAIYDDNSDIICLIECQGEQHYKPVKFFGGEEQFEIQQQRDELKRSYAVVHNYKLLEMPYTVRSKDAIYNYLSVLFSALNS